MVLGQKLHCYNLVPGWPLFWQFSGGFVNKHVDLDDTLALKFIAGGWADLFSL